MERSEICRDVRTWLQYYKVVEFLERIFKRKVGRRRALGIAALGLLTLLPEAAKSEADLDSPVRTDEHMKLITADGKVVEVEKKHIQTQGKKKLTNRQLKKWITSSR